MLLILGGGMNALKFVYGPQTGLPNDDPIDKYLYLDSSPYMEGTAKTTEIANNSAKTKIDIQFKNKYLNNVLKTEGYYIGKKRSQLNLERENPISTCEAMYQCKRISELHRSKGRYFFVNSYLPYMNNFFTSSAVIAYCSSRHWFQ